MTKTIEKSWNSYKQNDGEIMGWERENDGATKRATMMNDQGDPITFAWRSNHDPVAGHKVSVVMVDKGVTGRPTHPILFLNHDTGEVLREQNAPSPIGTRPIMLWLTIWIIAAMVVAAGIISQTTGVTTMALTLIAAAFVVWRLAIATSDLRADERTQKRIQDEEKMCMEIMTSAWRLSANEVFTMTRREVA